MSTMGGIQLNLSFGDLSPELRQRMLSSSPELNAAYLASLEKTKKPLLRAIRDAEDFMSKHGENAKMRQAVEIINRFLSGEGSPEELDSIKELFYDD